MNAFTDSEWLAQEAAFAANRGHEAQILKGLKADAPMDLSASFAAEVAALALHRRATAAPKANSRFENWLSLLAACLLVGAGGAALGFDTGLGTAMRAALDAHPVPDFLWPALAALLAASAGLPNPSPKAPI
jgi:hypothetical protein